MTILLISVYFTGHRAYVLSNADNSIQTWVSETLKGAPFGYMVCGYKFLGNNIIIVLKNFKEIGIELPLLLSQLMERDVCFLPLHEQVSAPQGTERESCAVCLVRIALKSCLLKSQEF